MRWFFPARAGVCAALLFGAMSATMILTPIAARAADGSVKAAGPEILMSIFRDGTELVRAGDPPVSIADLAEGDELTVSVMFSGFATFRAVEVHLHYDAAGLEYESWVPGKSLRSALSLAPSILPDENRAAFVAALPKPLVLEAGKRFHVGDATFMVHDPSHVNVGLLYMEVLDENLAGASLGTKPAGRKAAGPELRKRPLGDGLWWAFAEPNPFAHITTITFSTPDSMFVTRNVVDRKGKLVRPLVADTYRGRYSTNWAGTLFSGEKAKLGEYVITFEAAGKVDSQVVTLVDPSEVPAGHH